MKRTWRASLREDLRTMIDDIRTQQASSLHENCQRPREEEGETDVCRGFLCLTGTWRSCNPLKQVATCNRQRQNDAAYSAERELRVYNPWM